MIEANLTQIQEIVVERRNMDFMSVTTLKPLSRYTSIVLVHSFSSPLGSMRHTWHSGTALLREGRAAGALVM